MGSINLPRGGKYPPKPPPTTGPPPRTAPPRKPRHLWPEKDNMSGYVDIYKLRPHGYPYGPPRPIPPCRPRPTSRPLTSSDNSETLAQKGVVMVANNLPVLDRRKESALKAAVLSRVLSRKFWMSLLGAVTAILAWREHTMDTNTMMLAVGGFIATYVLGQSYVDGKTAESVPSALQQALIDVTANQKAADTVNRIMADAADSGAAPAVAPQAVQAAAGAPVLPERRITLTAADTVPARRDTDGDL